VHPNPTSGNLFVKGQDIQYVELFNTMGQCVLTQMADNAANAEISLAGMPSGIYLLRVVTNDGSVSLTKVVKQ
jgi:hypothetical protein